jgi:hypothetical protein
MRVEDGCIYHWDGGGDWCTQDRWDYIVEGEDVKCAIEEHPSLSWWLENGPEVFMVLFVDVGWVSDYGGWGPGGHVAPGHYVEPGPAAIVEHDFDPENYGLTSGLVSIDELLKMVRNNKEAYIDWVLDKRPNL